MALTDARCRAAKPRAKQYQLVDTDGLELLVTPSGTKVWRLRYRTQTGERKRLSLGRYPEMGVAAARVEAGKIRTQVWTGGDPAAERDAKRVAGETLAAVVDTYVEEHRLAWKESTTRTYLSAIKSFTAWAEQSGVKRIADITPAALSKYRAHAIALPRRAKAKGGSRRDVISTNEPRSAATVNGELRAIKTMFQTLRKAGRLPSITSSDAITDNLGQLPLEQPQAQPLKPAQLRKLLAACKRHDAETYRTTREEHQRNAPIGTTPKYEPIGPLVLTMLLGGLRIGEALVLTRADLDLEDQTLRVLPGKTKRGRTVDLGVSPTLVRLLAILEGRSDNLLFNHTQATALAARQRLITEYGAPNFLWSVRNSRTGKLSAPTLRSTCGCFLTCAPSIFGAASVYRSASQLGHSVQVAERHYLGTLRRIPKDATTLEAAMEIEAEIAELLSQIGGS